MEEKVKSNVDKVLSVSFLIGFYIIIYFGITFLLKLYSDNIDRKKPHFFKDEYYMQVGEKDIINITGYDSVEVTWKSDDDNIAYIDDDSEVIANKVGETKISIYDGDDLLDTIILHVVSKKIPVKSVEIKTHINEIYIGEQIKLDYEILPLDATNKNTNWTSSDVGIATIDNNGVLVGIKEGKVKLNVITDDGSIRDSIEVNVIKKEKVLN